MDEILILHDLIPWNWPLKLSLLTLIIDVCFKNWMKWFKSRNMNDTLYSMSALIFKLYLFVIVFGVAGLVIPFWILTILLLIWCTGPTAKLSSSSDESSKSSPFPIAHVPPDCRIFLVHWRNCPPPAFNRAQQIQGCKLTPRVINIYTELVLS